MIDSGNIMHHLCKYIVYTVHNSEWIHKVQHNCCKQLPIFLFILRILAIHGAKTYPLVHFAWLFYNQIVFLYKFERSYFDQVVIDAKNV